MKIIIAPDSFKESLSARQVAEQVAAGFREVMPDATCILLPLADGGEGTVDAMVAATGGCVVPVSVTGPLGAPVEAFYGLTGDGRTAVIEMAAASGLMLVPPERRNPLVTTSFGTGELILAALDRGVSEIIIGIGGSATNDGGAGMLQALGAGLLDDKGERIGYGGGALARLARIETSGLDPRLSGVCIQVACDVSNPLLGEKGASAVFGPQKGATPGMVRELDANLARFAGLIARDMGKDVAGMPGAGAAGGMGAALLALGCGLRPGIRIVLDAVRFEEIAVDADLIITGEGRMDSQTVGGKAPHGVARIARQLGKPVIGIAGSLADDVDMVHVHGIDAVFAVVPRPCRLEDALSNAAVNLRRTARNIAATIKLARECGRGGTSKS